MMISSTLTSLVEDVSASTTRATSTDVTATIRTGRRTLRLTSSSRNTGFFVPACFSPSPMLSRTLRCGKSA